MNDDLAHLRLTAEKCRRFLSTISDAETVTRLTALAEECERKLQQLVRDAETQTGYGGERSLKCWKELQSHLEHGHSER